MEVLVIGGGVIGCSIAYHLQRSGVHVVLAERNRVASGASSAAAGMLAPLAESPEPGPFARLAQLGLQAFHESAGDLINESGIDFEYRREGILRVAETEEEARDLREALPWQRDTGAKVEWVDQRELLEIEPHLAPRILGALYTAGEGHVNPARLTAALAAAAVRCGARLLEGCAIEGFERRSDRITAARHAGGCLAVDQVVIAGGAWAGQCTEGLCAPIPVMPVRGQMAALGQTPAAIRHIVYSHDGYLVPKADGSVYVGATEETTAGFDDSVTAAGLHWLLGTAKRLVPALTEARYLRSWAGLRPCAPDGMPILGRLPNLQNATIAAAHFRNGILLSLVTGRLIADLLATGTVPPGNYTILPKPLLAVLGAMTRSATAQNSRYERPATDFAGMAPRAGSDP